jgi:membrane protein implicated in regulation of membrane protease activity
MMYEMICLWLACACLCIVGELHTPGLFFLLSGAGGSIGAAILAALDCSLEVQIIGFFLGMAVSFVILHKFVQRSEKKIGLRTNGEALIGMKGVMVRHCTIMERGLVNVRGEIWSAYGMDDRQPLQKGDVVEVVALKGCHLIVKMVSESKK